MPKHFDTTSDNPNDQETIDRICGVLKVVQSKKGYRFGIDSLLLCGFVKPGVQQVVDLGTGCGVIPLVLVRFGKAASAIGIEIQKALAERAKRSIELCGLSDKIDILCHDLKKLNGVLPAAKYDLVVSNPPYRLEGSGNIAKDQERALGRHELLCNLTDVIASASRLLKSEGRLVLIVPSERLPELLATCAALNVHPYRLRMIHGRIGLKSKTCLLEAKKAKKTRFVVEPPLIIYDHSDNYTNEVKEMLYPNSD